MLSRGKTLIGAVAVCLALAGGAVYAYQRGSIDYIAQSHRERLFDVQSVDTMKHSRDQARQALDDPAGYQSTIDRQMELIADLGATHAAIATPYDEEFIPVLRAWIASARAHGLSVWLRGNFSGWEGWFDYPRIDRTQHAQALRDFLRDHSDLFENGDIFSPCPECENGGPGDPRMQGDADTYNAFLIEEKRIADTAFAAQWKNVRVYTSMNADIAKEIITRETVRELGGTLLIDHFVRTVEDFARDIGTIPARTGATIGLGEVGAPIPDLNGELTPESQARYVDGLLRVLYLHNDTTPVVNYWTLMDGSTAIVDADYQRRPAYYVVRNYFTASRVSGWIRNSLGERLSEARITIADSNLPPARFYGYYEIFVPRQYTRLTVSAEGYLPQTITLASDVTATTTSQWHDVYLEPVEPSPWYRARASVHRLLRGDTTH